ncbi:MAG: RNA degradosome polyphosphate kinase [Dysgonamonadaceae bacterium]|jgi:polyphosphate kinase|nr:RNA degradosome polyphosphate kinase [Dysgonamonadaceae bacterium]
MKIKQEKTHYLERDISWMYFNHRVLQEAQDKTVPLLERLSFLGIYSNNLDEFFRVRVAVLNRIIELKELSLRQQKKTAQETLTTIYHLYKKYTIEFEDTFNVLKSELGEQGICILDEKQISEEQRKQIRQFFFEELNLHLYPRLFSKNSSFRDINDESVYLAIRILTDTGRKEYALLEIPSAVFGRFIEVASGDPAKKAFLFLDDVIRVCLPLVFIGQEFKQFDAYSFKLTKDAEIDIDINLGDTLKKVSKAVKNRKWGDPVRFIFDMNMPADLLKQIRKAFNVQKNDNVTAGGRYHNLKDLMSFPSCLRKDLKYPQWPALPVEEIMESVSVMDVVRKKDLLLHYPYHSFSNYIRLLREAAVSKDVQSIKITLYRLAKKSTVAEALICAAKNGKKVTAVIELLARFDEASNIYWTQKMQEAGINVILGIEGLKIHSKLTLIKGKRGSVACINTGNFHEGNAKAYTDLTLMTANRSITKEVDNVFLFIQRPYLAPVFRKLLVSPLTLRSSIKSLIHTEIQHAKKGKPAYIQCKLNHITDKEIIEKLYEASAAGVKIELLVRGSCSIVTGIKSISSNITIKGVIDRYLEHSRIFIFCNGGKEKYYIGSADWIPRNFDTRVEALAPVYDEKIQRELKMIVEYGLKDNLKARVVDGSGENQIVAEGAPFRSQEELYNYYNQ